MSLHAKKKKNLDNRFSELKRKEQSLDSKLQHNSDKEKELEVAKKNLSSQVEIVKRQARGTKRPN